MSLRTVEISVPQNVPSVVSIDGGIGPKIVEINQGPSGPNTVTSATTTTLTGILKGNGSVVGTATAGTDYLTPTGNGSGLTGLKVTRTFANQTEVDASTPDFAGQIGYNQTTENLVRSFGTGIGDWDSSFVFGSLRVLPSGNLVLASTNSGGLVSLSGESATDVRNIAFPDASGTVALIEGFGSLASQNGSIGGAFITGGDFTTQGGDVSISGNFITDDNFSTEGQLAFTGTSNVVMALPSTSGVKTYTFPDADGTVALTTSNVATATALATSRNIFGLAFNGTANVSGDATNTGHFASIPTGGAAGHFIMLQGAEPTLVAGRTAIYGIANGFGVKDGTGTARTVALSGNISLANNLTTSGNFALTLTTTGTTNVTLPVSGTLLASGGALGTPTSGTLTNCTGYPELSLAGVVRAVATTDLVRTSGGSGADSALTVSLASGKAYRIRGMVKLIGQTGGTLYSSLGGPNCTFENVIAIRPSFTFNAGNSSLTPYTSLGLHNASGASTQQVMFDGVINTSAAGNFTFAWSTTGASATRSAGSYIEATPLN